MKRNITQLLLTLSLSLGAILVALALLSLPVLAADQCVNPGGTGVCYDKIQTAVDAVNSGETVRVWSGTYNENVIISKSVTLLGGCDNAACTSRTPYGSIINGGGAGSVISITNGAVTIDGFTITGGDGSGNVYLAQSGSLDSGGGGIFIQQATAIIRDNLIENNVGSQISNTAGLGGGILVVSSTNPVGIYNNIIRANVAQSVTLVSSVPISAGAGGGIAIGDASSAVITGNQVLSNVGLRANLPPQNGWGGGGGLAWWGDNITIEKNIIQGNIGNEIEGNGAGGGMAMWGSVATVTNNKIMLNTAAISGTFADGGGLSAAGDLQTLTLTGNWVMSNTALITAASAATPQDTWVGGGGIHLNGEDTSNDSVTIQENRIVGNVAVRTMTTSGANSKGHAEGGGLRIDNVTTTLIIRNEVKENTSVEYLSLSGDGSTTWGGRPAGGGIHLSRNDNVTLNNNEIRDNITAKQQLVNNTNAGSESGGIAFDNVKQATVSTNTIAGNIAVITGSITSNTGNDYHPSGGGIGINCNQTNCNLSFTDNDVLNNTSVYSLTANGSNVEGQGHGGGFNFDDSAVLLQRNVISGNVARSKGNDGSGGGMQINESTVEMKQNRILGNRTSESGGSPVIWVWKGTLTSTNDVVARNTGGLGVGTDNPSSPARATVVNGTFYNNDWVGLEANDTASVVVTNTIVSNHDDGLKRNDVAATFVGNYNLLNNNNNYNGGVAPVSPGANDITGQDPLFVNAANDDFHLTSSSPAINKGTSLGAPGLDFEDDPRPQGSGVDIGADEFLLQNIYLPILLKGG